MFTPPILAELTLLVMGKFLLLAEDLCHTHLAIAGKWTYCYHYCWLDIITLVRRVLFVKNVKQALNKTIKVINNCNIFPVSFNDNKHNVDILILYDMLTCSYVFCYILHIVCSV